MRHVAVWRGRRSRAIRRFRFIAFGTLMLILASLVLLGGRAPRPLAVLAAILLIAWATAVGGAFSTMARQQRDHERLRRDLMADVAHELRTPLTVMQGTLEGLRDGVYPRDDARIEQLLEETRVLSRLVDDLRTLAQSESGTLALQKESTDFDVLARDLVQAFAADAAARQLSLVVRSEGPAVADADPLRIRQVMANLISNALRWTPAGGSVVVAVSATRSGAKVEVRDTGRGMTPAELARAFDRFYKGSESRGSGLGLTIARNLVRAHGGELTATSTPGQGTTIAFTV